MKRMFTILLAMNLLFSSVSVHAASTLPINHGNKYVYGVTGGGEKTWEVPFTANYKLTLAGTEGASYSAGGGGYGTTLVKTVRLVKGTQLKVVLPERPAYTYANATVTIPSGSNAAVYLNGDLYMLAGGGGARINNAIAPDGCTSVNVGSDGSLIALGVHWHSGNGKSGPIASNTFPTVYSTTYVGGCYGWAGHTHNATGTCPKSHSHNDGCYSIPDSPWNNCSDCTSNGATDGAGYREYHCNCCDRDFRGTNGWHHCYGSKHFKQVCHDQPLNTWNCGNQPVNTQTIKCGFQHGQINPVTNQYTPTPCSGAWDSATSNNTGAAKFTVELCEQDTVHYGNGLVEDPIYKGGSAELVLVDDTVCYYKRR